MATHSRILICKNPWTGCGRRLLRIPWTSRRTNQSILKEINTDYPLEGLMLKLKLQCFVHLLRRAESSGKTLRLGKIEGKRRRGQLTQWMWIWTNSRRRWSTGKPDVLQSVGSQSQTRFSDGTTNRSICHNKISQTGQLEIMAIFFLSISGGWKSKIRLPKWLVSGENSLPGYKNPPSRWASHGISCGCAWRDSEEALWYLFLQGTNSIISRPQIMISFLVVSLEAPPPNTATLEVPDSMRECRGEHKPSGHNAR